MECQLELIINSFLTFNHDHLQQYTVNFNPVDFGYDCQVTIWLNTCKYERNPTSYLW